MWILSFWGSPPRAGGFQKGPFSLQICGFRATLIFDVFFSSLSQPKVCILSFWASPPRAGRAQKGPFSLEICVKRENVNFHVFFGGPRGGGPGGPFGGSLLGHILSFSAICWKDFRLYL